MLTSFVFVAAVEYGCELWRSFIQFSQQAVPHKISLLCDLPGAEGIIPYLCSPGALWLLIRELGISCSLNSKGSGHGCSCSSLETDLLGKTFCLCCSEEALLVAKLQN